MKKIIIEFMEERKNWKGSNALDNLYLKIAYNLIKYKRAKCSSIDDFYNLYDNLIINNELITINNYKEYTEETLTKLTHLPYNKIIEELKKENVFLLNYYNGNDFIESASKYNINFKIDFIDNLFYINYLNTMKEEENYKSYFTEQNLTIEEIKERIIKENNINIDIEKEENKINNEIRKSLQNLLVDFSIIAIKNFNLSIKQLESIKDFIEELYYNNYLPFEDEGNTSINDLINNLYNEIIFKK